MDIKGLFSLEIIKMVIAFMVGFVFFGGSYNPLPGIATLLIYGIARVIDEIKKLR